MPRQFRARLQTDGQMRKYVRHIITALIAFACVIALNFALPRLMPGDPVQMLTGIDSEILTQEQYDYYYGALGLDKSAAEQFGIYLRSVFDGSFGYSYHYNMTVADLLADRLPVTMQIAVPAAVISALLALFTGLAAARRRKRALDTALTSVNVFVQSVPAFLIAMVLLIVFSFKLGWFPYGNLSSPDASGTGFFADRLWHLFLPVLTLTLAYTPSKYLLMRNTAASAAEEKYVMYAEARGQPRGRIDRAYVFRNICRPFVTMVGTGFGAVVAGSVVVEMIFSVGGMGELIASAVTDRDYPVLQGCLFVIALITVAACIITDIICLMLEPRAGRGREI